jgi:hypothetical protein
MLQGSAAFSAMTVLPARCRNRVLQAALSAVPGNTLLRSLPPASSARKAQRQGPMQESALPAVQGLIPNTRARQSAMYATWERTLAR